MKFNTSIFICLFFSAIIAIKANDIEDVENSIEYGNTDTQPEVEENEQGVEEGTNNQPQEIQEAAFEFKPSKRLQEMENNMSNSSKAFVGDGKVKKTLTDTYKTTMATDVAKAGFDNANHQWLLMLEGPEASRVFGTFGKNFNTIVTSTDGVDMINMLATTVHVLLAKAGEEKMSSKLSDIMSMTYSLFTSPNMPEIVNKTGGLVITAVNKPGAALFTKTYWTEVKKLLTEKNLNQKLKKYFANLMSMMKSLRGMMHVPKQLKRRRTIA